MTNAQGAPPPSANASAEFRALGLDHWSLELGHSLVIGHWSLVIPLLLHGPIRCVSTHRTAWRTSDVASFNSSFSLRWPRWTSTVLELRLSCRAMSFVLLPWPINWKISNSRSLSFSIGE